MTTFEAPNYIIGNSATITAQLSSVLTSLDQALSALEPAPNATTVQFNSTLLLDDGLGNTITAGVNQIDFKTLLNNPSVISNSSGQEMNIASQSNLNLSATGGLYMTPDFIEINTNNGILATCGNSISFSAGGSVNLTANNDPMNLTADGDITFNTPSLSNILLNAENINAYGYALPICFTRERHDNFSYNLGGQQMELVYNMDMNVPSQFFVDNPQSGYTSNIWKIDYALNCYDCSNIGDKGIALYIEFQDQNSTIYTPNTYNLDTPYAVWNNPSQYHGVSHSNFQNFNWSDFVDLSALLNTGSGNLPLRVQLYFAGDSAFNAKFIQTITLTRTNVV